MTTRDASYIRIMTMQGWTVNKVYTESDRWHFRVFKESAPDDWVMGFTIEQIFEFWMDREDVQEEFLRMKVTHKEEGGRDALQIQVPAT